MWRVQYVPKGSTQSGQHSSSSSMKESCICGGAILCMGQGEVEVVSRMAQSNGRELAPVIVLYRRALGIKIEIMHYAFVPVSDILKVVRIKTP